MRREGHGEMTPEVGNAEVVSSIKSKGMGD